jgi:hypothetical protein
MLLKPVLSLRRRARNPHYRLHDWCALRDQSLKRLRAALWQPFVKPQVNGKPQKP